MSEIILYDHRASICSQMARLALVEKGVTFARREIDIMETGEQFESWYVALNPKAVVPTLKIGDEVVTDTIAIVHRVQELDGPDLSGDDSTDDWLRAIMGLHYGVLLYRNRLNADGTAPQIVQRGRMLERLRDARPDLEDLVAARLDGNRRLRELLRDRASTEAHVDKALTLIDRMAAALENSRCLSGDDYSLADCFATAALARFRIHGLARHWAGTALEGYYAAMRERPSFAGAEVIDTGHERDL